MYITFDTESPTLFKVAGIRRRECPSLGRRSQPRSNGT